MDGERFIIQGGLPEVVFPISRPPYSAHYTTKRAIYRVGKRVPLEIPPAYYLVYKETRG